MDCLLFADDLVLHILNRVFNMHSIVFFAACDRAGMKISTKQTEALSL